MSFLLVMSVDGIQTAASCGAGILRILSECHCSLYSITEQARTRTDIKNKITAVLTLHA